MVYPERCRGCGLCGPVCPWGGAAVVGVDAAPDRSACTACGACADACAYGARELVGEAYTVAELVAAVERDQMFYESSGGGVTLSGGEVMTQPLSFLLPLVEKLERKGIHIAVDTCGQAPWQAFEAVLPHVDVFLYDLKLMDPEDHRRYTGADNLRILRNLISLGEAGAKIHLRLPIIGNVNDSTRHADEVTAFLGKGVGVEQISLLPYHKVGRDKGPRVGLEPGPAFTAPCPEQLQALARRYQRAGYQVQIGG